MPPAPEVHSGGISRFTPLLYDLRGYIEDHHRQTKYLLPCLSSLSNPFYGITPLASKSPPRTDITTTCQLPSGHPSPPFTSSSLRDQNYAHGKSIQTIPRTFTAWDPKPYFPPVSENFRPCFYSPIWPHHGPNLLVLIALLSRPSPMVSTAPRPTPPPVPSPSLRSPLVPNVRCSPG